ncbi:MAG TPA: thioredoxin fold domain-containing protein [Opitutaceae bacterium]
MRTMLPLLVLLCSGSAFAASVGESYDQVIAEKGAPVGTMGTGSVRILTYGDAVIKIRDGSVVSIRQPDKPTAYVPPAPSAPATKPVAASYDGPAVWETDFGTAMEQARIRKCHVLILYTGSDWCPWCKKMDAEVYSRPEFGSYSHDKFVLLKLDYLRYSPITPENKVQNAELGEKYGVNSYPQVVIVDSKGKFLTRFKGYREGGAQHFIGMLSPFE